MNWKWPYRKGGDLVPWYLILWRGLFSPLLFLGLALGYLGTFCIFGPSEAKKWLIRAL